MTILDSDHGGGDAGGGEAPLVASADNTCTSHIHLEISDPATGRKTVFERSLEQGSDGALRPIVKKKLVQATEEPDWSA